MLGLSRVLEYLKSSQEIGEDPEMNEASKNNVKDSPETKQRKKIIAKKRISYMFVGMTFILIMCSLIIKFIYA